MFIFNKTVHDTVALAREPRTNTLRTAENDRHVTFFKEIPGGCLIKEGHVVSDVYTKTSEAPYWLLIHAGIKVIPC